MNSINMNSALSSGQIASDRMNPKLIQNPAIGQFNGKDTRNFHNRLKTVTEADAMKSTKM